jgi:hypothetical protein
LTIEVDQRLLTAALPSSFLWDVEELVEVA